MQYQQVKRLEVHYLKLVVLWLY